MDITIKQLKEIINQPNQEIEKEENINKDIDETIKEIISFSYRNGLRRINKS